MMLPLLIAIVEIDDIPAGDVQGQRLVVQTDGRGNPTTTFYDSLGRKTRTLYADGKDEQMLSFDAVVLAGPR